MVIAFVLIALVVGALCGAAIGYETRDLRSQPTGWRPWVLFVGVALVVAGAAALVERINETVTLSGVAKTGSLLAGAVAFTVALFIVRRRR